MSFFKNKRAELAELLAPLGITVHDHLPGRLVPPCALVVSGSPYVERTDGDTFASRTLRHEIWLIVSPAANDVETDALDDLLEQAGDIVAASGWSLERIEQPFTYSVQGASLLASTIHVTTDVGFNLP